MGFFLWRPQLALAHAQKFGKLAPVALLQPARAALAHELLEIGRISTDQGGKTGQAEPARLRKVQQAGARIGRRHILPFSDVFFLDK
jgi:hypothetical protein